MHFGSLLNQAGTSLLTASMLSISLTALPAFVTDDAGRARAQSPARAFQSASSQGPEQTTSLARARQLYQQRRYAEAANYFQQAVQKEAAGVGGYLWIAHCHYALGNIRQAIPDYVRVRDSYIGTNESKVAAQYLARLDPKGTAQAAAAGAGKSSPTMLAFAGAGGAPSGLLDRIEIVRPVVGHPELSPSTISIIRESIRNLPPAVQRLLQDRGVKFCITTSLIDKYPAMGYQEGRGYDGYTYKSCPGMFKDNTVIICERFVDETSNEVLGPIASGPMTDTFYHEIGHALDSCLGWYSAQDDYRHAYYLDMARIPADAAARLAYFMQKSVAGQQESCGEITAVCLNSGEHNSQDVQTYFPLTMALIKKKLNVGGMPDDSQGQIAGKLGQHHI
jgi:tetratricopeptide (TPR) repeat protein